MPADPLLLHCPNGTGPGIDDFFFKTLVPRLSGCSSAQGTQGIEVITYNNGRTPFPVERQLVKMQVPHRVLARDEQPWRWSIKINSLYDFLRNRAGSTDLVMIIDGNDTIFTRFPSLSEITLTIARYAPAQIVFCATPSNWPPHFGCRQYERALYPRPFCHLSAGAFVGSISAIVAALDWIRKRMPTGAFNRPGGGFDDQLAWRLAHFAAPVPIAIDSSCQVFKRCGEWLLDHETLGRQ